MVAKIVPIRARPGTNKQMPTIELTKHGRLLCYEQAGGRWFRSSQWAVEDGLAKFQELYDNIACVSLGDLHESLDIIETTRDESYGWNSAIHGYGILVSTDLKKEGFMGMDEPVLVIIPNGLPEKDYKDHI